MGPRGGGGFDRRHLILRPRNTSSASFSPFRSASIFMIVKPCEDTDHCRDSAGECDGPLHLPCHNPKHETRDYNKGQNPDDKHCYPHTRVLGIVRCPARVIFSDRGRRLACFFQVVTLRGESDIVNARGLIQHVIGVWAGVRDLTIIDRPGLEMDWLWRALVTPASGVVRCGGQHIPPLESRHSEQDLWCRRAQHSGHHHVSRS